MRGGRGEREGKGRIDNRMGEMHWDGARRKAQVGRSRVE